MDQPRASSPDDTARCPPRRSRTSHTGREELAPSRASCASTRPCRAARLPQSSESPPAAEDFWLIVPSVPEYEPDLLPTRHPRPRAPPRCASVASPARRASRQASSTPTNTCVATPSRASASSPRPLQRMPNRALYGKANVVVPSTLRRPTPRSLGESFRAVRLRTTQDSVRTSTHLEVPRLAASPTAGSQH